MLPTHGMPQIKTLWSVSSPTIPAFKIRIGSAHGNLMIVVLAQHKTLLRRKNGIIAAHDKKTVEPAFVKYCLAESIEAHCKVTFNVFMLFISVICNAAKLAVFLLILLLPGFRPLITIGDAIASFLTYPDPVTARIGAPAVAEDGSWTPPILSTPWKPQRCHWFCGASLRQWCVGTLA